jgi:NADH-quinone oxidoreductase subunit L
LPNSIGPTVGQPIAIDGSTALVQRVAATVRWLQSGYLYHYAFAMILGLIALLGGVWWVVTHAGA